MANPIEQDTLLGAAKYGPGAKDGAFIPRQIKRPADNPPPPDDDKLSFNIDHETRRIWHFEHKLPTGRGAVGTANEITQLTCRTRASDYQPVVVCDSVRWEDVLVTLVPGGKAMALTLTSPYLLTQRFLEDGEISNDIASCVQADPAELWRRLPQKIDVAFELMFGFRFNEAKTAYAPLSLESVTPETLKSMTLLGQTTTSEAQQAGTLAANTGVATVFRFKASDVIVTISLVCCKQDWHFTPGLPAVPGNKLFSGGPSPLGVARLFPLTYVRPMFPLHKIETRTRLARPAVQPHAHPHPAPELLKHLKDEDGINIGGSYSSHREPIKGTDSTMAPTYSAAMYADHNWPLSGLGVLGQGLDAILGSSKALAPFWSLTFSHYHTQPAAERDYLVVLPRRVAGKPVALKSSHASTIGDAHMGPRGPTMTVMAPRNPNCDVVRLFKEAAEYEGTKSDLYKFPGQGLFDNVHLAPLMGDPYANAAAVARGFGDVAMAPFCVHDCLHTHWRWMPDPTTVDWFDEKIAPASVGQWNYGFNAEGKPYSAPGMTMVPVDQQVSLRLECKGGSTTPNAFVYIAEALEPKVDHASIFFHHGSAFSAMVSEPSNFLAARNQPALDASLDPGVTQTDSSSTEYGYNSWNHLVPAYVNWARFYWHLRYDFIKGQRRERVKVHDWSKLQELPDLAALRQTTVAMPELPDPGMGGQTSALRADAIPCMPPSQPRK